MHRPSYGDRDYAFAQRLLTLRTNIGLTQVGLAELLGVSRRAVGEWEAGSNYPKAQNLQALIEMAVRASAFAAGREEEQIRALWKAAHQKVMIDESWLFALLSLPSQPPTQTVIEETGQAEEGSVATASVTAWGQASQLAQGAPSIEMFASRAPAASGARVDWGDALDVSSFYGRQGELATLDQWMVQQRCRVVSVLGMGGIGKSALVTSVMRQLAAHYQVVLFRSLRNAPECSTLLEECLQRLAPQPRDVGASNLEALLSLLLQEMRQQRVLLVFDNLESVLQAGDARGRPRPGYEGYARLLQAVTQTAHQSCLLLTSRENPIALRALEGRYTQVRSLRLTGLEVSACEQLLASHELLGSQQERARLVEHYQGNPLALNIVAETIFDLFGGQIAPFLAQDSLVFGSISDLLDEQVGRLSALEQTLLFWLAIFREPVTLEELRARLFPSQSGVQVLEALDGLHRRSLVERGQRPGSLTLQSVVLEFVSERLVNTACQEIEHGQLWRLRELGLSQAQAKDYVRESQQRLLLAPLLERLQSVYRGRAQLEERLIELLEEVRSWEKDTQGYASANLVTLLRVLRGNLRGQDLSRLVLRGVHLQDVEMQDAILAGSLIQESVFREAFDAIWGVTISPRGKYWAAAGRRGEVRVWGEEGQILHSVWQAHADTAFALAFSQDECTLASASYDGSLKFWDVESRALLWSGWHPHGIQCLAIAPDSSRLATGGNDAAVRLWDTKRGTSLQELPHPRAVFALAWSPDGHVLASGDVVGTIRVWQMQSSGSITCIQTLSGHSSWVRGLAFAPDGSVLASASWDGSLKLWEVESGRCLRMLVGHTQQVQCVAWSADGATLASGGRDHTIRLWDAQQGSCRAVLHGHSAFVRGLVFIPGSPRLLSGSDDGTLRVWDILRGESVHVLQGYEACLYDVAWSPDGTELASVGTESVVSLWKMTDSGEGTLRGLLRGHEWIVDGVAWRPGGGMLASCGWDDTIRLWDPASGRCLQVIGDLDHPDTVFWGVAFSPDGKLLASAAFRRGVLLWELKAGSGRWIGRELATWIRYPTFSPDSTYLAGGADDNHVYVWDTADGTLLQRLAGHHGVVMSVAFSPDGTQLASGSQGKGELFVWDVQTGACLSNLYEPSASVSALAWNPTGGGLVSGGSDGLLRWWNLRKGECVRVRKAHEGTVHALKRSPDGRLLASCGDDGAIRIWNLEIGEHLHTLRRDRPYERLNITGIRGLTQAEITTLRTLGAIEDSVL